MYHARDICADRQSYMTLGSGSLLSVVVMFKRMPHGPPTSVSLQHRDNFHPVPVAEIA
jgi:hypothetical protein